MKTLILTLLPFMALSQLPYTWTAGVNPGWTSSNGVLSWKPGCTVVTTNCTGNYTNNTNSSYTSHVINTTCSTGSTVAITFTASGSAEYSFDFLFIEYSLNGGATWINPYGAGTGWTGNFGGGTTIPAVTALTSANFMFRFTFASDGTIRDNGYKITDFDIQCLTVLPVEIVSFTGKQGNHLSFETFDENGVSGYKLDRSTDGYNWETITELPAGSIKYHYQDLSYVASVNYYRLVIVSENGLERIYSDLVSIDNRKEVRGVLRVVNGLGQDVLPDAIGVVIIQYADGSIERKMNQ